MLALLVSLLAMLVAVRRQGWLSMIAVAGAHLIAFGAFVLYAGLYAITITGVFI